MLIDNNASWWNTLLYLFPHFGELPEDPMVVDLSGGSEGNQTMLLHEWEDGWIGSEECLWPVKNQ